MRRNVPSLTDMLGHVPQFDAVGVGQNEQPLPDVCRPDFCRAKDACFNLVTHCEKVAADAFEAEGDMPEDVFREQERCLHLSEDSADMRPQVARVLVSEAFSGLAERLTGISGSEDIHFAAPRLAVKGDKVRPDRRFIQGRVFHPGHESGRGVCVSFDEANSSIFMYCERNAKFEPSGSCGKGDAAKCLGM